MTLAAAGPTGPWWTRLAGRTRAAVLAAEVLVVLVLWQVLVGGLRLVSPVFLPPPLEIVDGFAQLAANPTLPEHLLTSLAAWTIGFTLAVVVGVSLGIVLGRSLPVDRLAGPLLWTLYATPWLAYRPLSLIWFGFGLAPIVFLVFIASLFPTLLNTAVGVRTVDPSLQNAGRVFGIGRLGTYRKILLPAALPFVLVGIRQSVVMATISLIVAEMTGASDGVGALMAIQTARYRTEQVFALVIVTVIWSVGLGAIIRAIGERFAPWQTDSRDA